MKATGVEKAWEQYGKEAKRSVRPNRKRRKTEEPPEVAKVIVLSTGHVAASIAMGLKNEAFDGDPAPIDRLANLSGQDGWLVYTGYDDLYYRTELKGAGKSAIEAFIDLMRWAQSKGARYVLFDSDGPYLKWFPTYDW